LSLARRPATAEGELAPGAGLVAAGGVRRGSFWPGPCGRDGDGRRGCCAGQGQRL